MVFNTEQSVTETQNVYAVAVQNHSDLVSPAQIAAIDIRSHLRQLITAALGGGNLEQLL
jgi:hypothetical protein